MGTIIVAMPEATMNKNCSLIFRKNNIRTSRKVFYMEPEAIPGPMKQRSDLGLRIRVLGTNSRHIPASFFFGQDIHIT